MNTINADFTESFPNMNRADEYVNDVERRMPDAQCEMYHDGEGWKVAVQLPDDC